MTFTLEAGIWTCGQTGEKTFAEKPPVFTRGAGMTESDAEYGLGAPAYSSTFEKTSKGPTRAA